MMRASLHTITPMLPTGGELGDAIRFYVAKMGFSVDWETNSMAGLTREGVSILLVENRSREWAENASFSIGVTNLDALHLEFHDRGARVGPLETKAWGRREFHMIVPSGVCFQFYERSLATSDPA